MIAVEGASPEEIAAIAAALAAIEQPALPQPPAESRWKRAARTFDADVR